MWKVFLVISTVVLLGAGYFAYQNKLKSAEITDERKRNDDVFAQLEKDLEAEKTKLAETEAAVRSLKDETDQLKTKVAQVEAKSSDLELQASTLKQNLELAVAKLDEDRGFIQKIPDIEIRRQEIEEGEQEIAQLEAIVSGLQQELAQVAVRKTQLEQAADALQKLKDDQVAGRIRGEFTSVVKKAFNQWGFVVIDGGNDQGVVNRAQLDVMRLGSPICKLIVTTVEPGEAVAEVVPGSLAPGEAIRPGDVVTKSEVVVPPPAPPVVAAADLPEADSAVDTSSALFGPGEDEKTEAALESADTSSNPFGAPGEDETDPFGADPFGADPFGN